MPRTLPFLYAAEELGDALAERLTPILNAAQLTSAQFNVLYLLIEEGPMKLSELAKYRRCVKSNVSYLARAMQGEGLIELSVSEADQRARVVAASKLGRSRYDVAKASAQKVEQALRRALGGDAVGRLADACLQAARAIDQSA